jgi:hypothetical protein
VAQAIFLKAEALFAAGNFELSLVFYHKGYHLREDRKEFLLGISKATQAIENVFKTGDMTPACGLDSSGGLNGSTASMSGLRKDDGDDLLEEPLGTRFLIDTSEDHHFTNSTPSLSFFKLDGTHASKKTGGGSSSGGGGGGGGTKGAGGAGGGHLRLGDVLDQARGHGVDVVWERARDGRVDLLLGRVVEGVEYLGILFFLACTRPPSSDCNFMIHLPDPLD